MSIFKHKKILITHNGAFHTDDLFTTAALSILNNGNIKIIRTRDKNIMTRGDYVYDVGGEYDGQKFFDHHQKGGAGSHPNGIPYSSFGLVWKAYGEKICGNKNVAEQIDLKIVQPIDAIDNGIDIFIPKFKNITPYTVQNIFMANYPTWQENNSQINKIFKQEVGRIILLLAREIKIAKDDIKGRKIILEVYNETEDKRIIFLEEPLSRYLIRNVLARFPEPIYFIYPSKYSSSWKVEAVPIDLTTYESRKSFPESWRGLMDNNLELKKMTGVDDVIFCHKSGFFIHVGSKEGAFKLAQKSLSM